MILYDCDWLKIVYGLTCSPYTQIVGGPRYICQQASILEARCDGLNAQTPSRLTSNA